MSVLILQILTPKIFQRQYPFIEWLTSTQSRNLDYLNKGVDVFSVSTQFREISLTSLGGCGVD